MYIYVFFFNNLFNVFELVFNFIKGVMEIRYVVYCQ